MTTVSGPGSGHLHGDRWGGAGRRPWKVAVLEEDEGGVAPVVPELHA